jgi:hypothetical protein
MGDTRGLPQRYSRANSLGEIRSVIGGLRRVVDPRPRAELIKGQLRIHQADAVEVVIDETVEDITEVEAAHLACDPRIAHDVDGAAVRQEVIELRPIGKLIDSIQVDPEKPARPVGRRPDVVEIDVFAPEIGSHPHTRSRSSPTM